MLKRTLLLLILFCISPFAMATSIHIVAAENFYGDVAKTIGGPYVEVNSILNSPTADPHLFSTTPQIAKQVADANIIIYNGLDYDPWIENLLSTKSPQQIIINISQLIGKQPGDNPHIWYDPQTMPHFAKALTQTLSQLDPAHKQYYAQQLSHFAHQCDSLEAQIQTIKAQHQNTKIIATEPIFNDMANALGLQILGKSFQTSIMNNTVPSANAIIQFENALRQHQVRLLIYNNQVKNPQTERMQSLAETLNIPTLGVSEIMPSNQHYIAWMTSALTQLQALLSR